MYTTTPQVRQRRENNAVSENTTGTLFNRAVEFERILNKHNVTIKRPEVFNASNLLGPLDRHFENSKHHSSIVNYRMMISILENLNFKDPNADQIEILLQARNELDQIDPEKRKSNPIVNLVLIALLLTILAMAHLMSE